MKIITRTCRTCGTIVAANEIERRREMKCPGLNCESIFRFHDLSEAEKAFFLEHREEYRL